MGAVLWALAEGALWERREIEADKTQVVLRLAYYLPTNLKQFVGVPGTWAHVNDILEENMAAMKVRPLSQVQEFMRAKADRIPVHPHHHCYHWLHYYLYHHLYHFCYYYHHNTSCRC